MAGLIAERFDAVASACPDRIAIYGLSEGVTRTFAEVREDTATIGRALAQLNLPPCPTIVSNVGNRTGFIPLFLAGLSRGASLMPLDGGAAPREVLDLADAYGADLVVVSDDAAAFREMTTVRLPAGLAGITRRPDRSPWWRLPNETDGLVLKVTSGSTGSAKVAVTTELGVLNDGRHVADAMAIAATDIGCATVPLAHSYGMSVLLLPLLIRGTPLVLRDRFVHAQWAGDVERMGITVFPGVPFIFDYLRRAGEAAAAIAGIRLVVTAGAPIDFETVKYFKSRFDVKIHSLYGTTETGSISFDSSSALHDRITVGWPMPETTVSLTPTPEVAPGGRIFARGSALSRGYARNEAADESGPVFTGDGFLTADLAKHADDGQLVLIGRVSGFVNVAGRKVSPGEVERVIAELPGVSHVFVMGIADGARGQELVACVSRLTPDLSVASVRAHCATALSPYKVPRRVVFADELPRTARGKIARDDVEAHVRNIARRSPV
jgi:acyl-coenzyme A synthetase/AMP-(fatty) acid ligase